MQFSSTLKFSSKMPFKRIYGSSTDEEIGNECESEFDSDSSDWEKRQKIDESLFSLIVCFKKDGNLGRVL